MKKIIKAYGTSTIITLSPEDLKIYDLKVGDVVEVHLIKLGKIDEN